VTCREVLERVEAFASHELAPDAAARAHIETCPQCAAALADARRIESFLTAWPAPEAPARFTAAVQHRIRRMHWQAEQQVDRLFNAAIVLAGVLVLVGVAAMFNVGFVLGIAGALTHVMAVAGTAAVQKAAPSLATYLAAMGLLASALVMWWWSEGNLER
jgi:anti-sigma factor RsiW